MEAGVKRRPRLRQRRVPDLEAGDKLAKQLVYLAEAEMAGIVLGTRAPITLTSRAGATLSQRFLLAFPA